MSWPVVGRNTETTRIQATEGLNHIDREFANHHTRATQAGLLRGALHRASASASNGTDQADFFIKHGGNWTCDGKTLPGVLNMEWEPQGTECHGLNYIQMVDWIWEFSNRYKQVTSRHPVIYTYLDWWGACTKNTFEFKESHPLMFFRHVAQDVGTLPGLWAHETIWEHDDHFEYGGNTDLFHGNAHELQHFANGRDIGGMRL